MNPAVVFLTFLAAALVLMLPRPAASLAIIGTVCYVTQGQQISVGGFHFTVIRIVLLVALCRVLIRGDLKRLEFNKIDWAVTLYPIILTTVATLRIGTSEMFVNQLGTSYDTLLSYYAFRCLVRNTDEIEAFLRGLGFVIVPMAASMIFESLARHNLFEWMGGGIGGQVIREGRLRCQGAFRSAITAGSFGGTLFPMFLMMWKVGRYKLSASIGLLSALAIVYTSNSSGPLMAFLGGIVAVFFWPWREEMRKVRWGIVGCLVCFQLVMKVPVWFLMSRISDLTGGDGSYRSHLIDQFIRHFSDWWLIGTSDTGNWVETRIRNPVTGEILVDITNQYVFSGITGGIWALWLYVLIIVRCFRSLGNAAKILRPHFKSDEMLLWGVGAALFAHAVTILSVTYFDQMYVAWWGLLGMISSLTAYIIKAAPITEAEEEAPEAMTVLSEAA